MKIAIFHDYIGTIGGADKLILTLARDLKADVITTDVDFNTVSMMGFEDVNIISLGKTIKIAPLKQISASLRFMLCDFSKKYDFFIFSNNWAHLAAGKHKPNLLYCQSTPVRVFYDLYDVYLRQQSFFSSLLFRIWVAVHRKFYEHYMKHVCVIIANSISVQERVKKYLDRSSKVVYPPVDISRFRFEEFGDFWLSVNRLYPEKRIELQIEAFRQLPEEKLLIIGGCARADRSSEYASDLLKRFPKNVLLLGNVPEDELILLYARCKAFIITSMEEPFGMAPVEAMASGKAVVGMREGGCLETVIDGSTGFLVGPQVKDIVNAIKSISMDPSRFKEKCIEQASKFSVDIFLKKMRKEINETNLNNTSGNY
ncbi:MAG: glycosyltransferase [Euryarchaeota archaeon]|nr:glycosyltransferase [Euryarchaeota archaeon]MBU4220592.1 glycosyltransferase [Euryarchaeota archaeon]MBU4340373.1 glycosyltransferase [Euryarchaeota archaeon]MBU4454030.1 glycosyltransferase [Euryarchaeota archaeon]MCG2735384.1 glycosyltransferase [Candidatus Methanoperedenaceae archaeon]